jgi:uncharacterized zinc-type alcohol dehydrogenase-like protein
MEILFCGICHSDIHQARDEWGGSKFPMVPGHEFVGRITRVGLGVKKFKVGDLAGVGCVVDSCGRCEPCRWLAGSMIGGIAETQEMLDHCGKHGIVADVEIIPIQKVNEAYERTLKNDVKYRFSIDLASLKK